MLGHVNYFICPLQSPESWCLLELNSPALQGSQEMLIQCHMAIMEEMLSWFTNHGMRGDSRPIFHYLYNQPKIFLCSWPCFETASGKTFRTESFPPHLK